MGYREWLEYIISPFFGAFFGFVASFGLYKLTKYLDTNWREKFEMVLKSKYPEKLTYPKYGYIWSFHELLGNRYYLNKNDFKKVYRIFIKIEKLKKWINKNQLNKIIVEKSGVEYTLDKFRLCLDNPSLLSYIGFPDHPENDSWRLTLNFSDFLETINNFAIMCNFVFYQNDMNEKYYGIGQPFKIVEDFFIFEIKKNKKVKFNNNFKFKNKCKSKFADVENIKINAMVSLHESN
jgi:hypothetical protein